MVLCSLGVYAGRVTDRTNGEAAMSDDTYGYEFLRAEMGQCAYEQGRIQPVAVFMVPDRRGEVSLSERIVESRIANKVAHREHRERSGKADFSGLDTSIEEAALQAIAELKAEHETAPTL